MKKNIAIACAALFTLSLAGCGTSASSAGSTASESTASSAATTAESSASSAEGYRIAIVQQMDHASLDQIRAAIEAELDAKAAEQGIAIEYELFNGQNDATTLNQIGTQVITDGYDAIIPIATLAAQEVDGVASVASGSMQSVRGLLSKASLHKPVAVVIEDGVATVTLHIVGKYGSKIVPVCEKVQENVKQTIQNMTGITVSRVDVIVSGLAEETDA